jgi:hypothetical protein
MENAIKLLEKYIPENAVTPIVKFIFSQKGLHLKITRERSTKLGDYKQINRFQHRITINHNLNKYQFLITLLHEIAHYLTYKQYGTKVKPHGKEWKKIFGGLLSDYINTKNFPDELLPFLIKYAQNPKASTSGDGDLHLQLSKYNTHNNPATKYIFELEYGQKFELPNGVVYQLQEKRRTRYKCMRLDNRKIYLIHKNAEVFPIDNNK